MTYPDNSKVAYSYEQGQIKEVLLANGEKITWNNYTWQVPTQINFPGSSQAIIYDPLQRPLSIKVTDANNNLLINRSYSYDKVGNITQQGSEDGLTNYQYDLLDRLTTVTPSKTLQQKGLPIEGYSYDAIDNRIGSVHQPGNWLYNDNNQLIQWSNSNNLTTLNYSANGHLTKETSSGKEFTYSYDATDRLVSIKEGDREVASYQYDPFGRRISKSVNGVTTYFIYTDEGLLAELDERGNIQVAYGWQPSTLWGTSPLWQANISGNQTLQTASYNYLITDYLGTPQLAVNSRGQQTWKGIAEAFGKTQLDTANQITMNLRFPGQYYDQETGLHYNYFRDYNPNTGRYIQSDPIGLRGGTNIFNYVKANPLRIKDTYGLLYFSGLGKSEVTIVYLDDGCNLIVKVMRNPTAENLAAFIGSLPDNSIKEITFFGHGNYAGIEINTDSHDFLGWTGEMGGSFILSSGDNFGNLLGPKLDNNAQINLEGCNTARWTNNITNAMSQKFPNANVRGYRGYGVSNMIFGGNSRWGIGKTYRNGVVQ